MPNVNKVFIQGHLGKDPELRKTGSGSSVVNFSVATTESFRSKDGEKEVTDWHNIVAWGSLADWAAANLKKGSAASVVGKLKTRSWEKDGVKRYTTEVISEMILECGSAPSKPASQADSLPPAECPF